MIFCPSSNNVDVIVFSMHAKGAQKHCADDPIGTYIAPVPYFVQGYIQDYAQDMEEQGYDYEYPAVATYISCTAFTIQNQQFYFQLGCADGTSQALAVNIYTDKACTTRSVVDGYDDSNIDVSEIKVRDDTLLTCIETTLETTFSIPLANPLYSSPSKSVSPVSTGSMVAKMLTINITKTT
jgi:hypothetical protein